MSKILLCVGLPASGKTYFSKALVSKDGKWKRLNRDDLRNLIDNGKWSQQKEKLIRKAETELAKLFIDQGYNVIVDDCNLSPTAQNMWKNFAQQHKVYLEEKLFDTDVEECIARDLKRDNSVGEQVIRRMWRSYIAPQQNYVPPADKPPAVICDIDGTLANMSSDRSPYEWSKVRLDHINTPVEDIIRTYYKKGTHVILLSGRDSICREDTQDWLRINGVRYTELYMRDKDDSRKDVIIKRELYDQHIKDNYQVIAVFDDRPQVCRMWHELGMPLFKVGDPDLEF